MSPTDIPPRRISAVESKDPMRSVSVRIRTKDGPDPVREQLARIAQSQYVKSFDEGGFVRFAIEFTARCMKGTHSFPKSKYDQVSDDVFKKILEEAMSEWSVGQQATPLAKQATAGGALADVTNRLSARPGLVIPSRNYDYSAMLRDSHEISLVFNDMYNWLGNHKHRQVLEDRIRANERKTAIYLIHPESPVLNYVAAKSNKLHVIARTGDNRQLYDIKRSLSRLLENIIDDVGDKTRIIGHQWVHAYSLVMNETEAYATPYLNKRVGNDGIIHVYRSEPGSATAYMCKDLKDDLEDMVRYTTDLPSLNLVKYMQTHREFMNAELYTD